MLPAEHFVFALLSAWIIQQLHYWVVHGTILSFFTFQTNQRAALCERLL